MCDAASDQGADGVNNFMKSATPARPSGQRPGASGANQTSGAGLSSSRAIAGPCSRVAHASVASIARGKELLRFRLANRASHREPAKAGRTQSAIVDTRRIVKSSLQVGAEKRVDKT